jgi:AraC-like DNA-binding protein
MPGVIRHSRLLLHSNVSSSLGNVSLSGYGRNNRGVSLVNRRIFGQYALVYLIDGHGRMQAGNLPMVKCRAGDLIFLYPEIPHGYGPGPGESWNEFYVCFDGPAFDLWRQKGLLNPDRPVQHLPRIRHWLEQLEAVVDRRIADTPEGMLQRVCRLQQFLCDIAEEQPVAQQRLPWLEEAKRLLMESPEPNLPAIARALGLSTETFRKNFARETGHPPARYRAIRLINQARVLITGRGLRNKEIAETLGFYDEFHFSRRFQSITGFSTREFRRTLRTRDKTASKSRNSG